MVDREQTTFRLSEDHQDKLVAIRDKYNLSSKNKAIEMIIESFDLEDNSTDDSLVGLRRAVESQQEDIDLLKQALGIDSRESSASEDKEFPPTTARSASTTDANIPHVIASDGRKIPLDSWSLTEVEQASSEELPAVDPFREHNIPETTSDRLKAAAMAVNHVRTEMDNMDRNTREMELLLGRLFGGANQDTLQGYLTKLVDRGLVYVDPLSDPMFDNDFDDVVRDTFSEVYGTNYVERKQAGNLPSDWDELLPAWYPKHVQDAYYLDEEMYLNRVEDVIYELREAVLLAAQKAGSKRDQNRQRVKCARQYTLRRILSVVDARTWCVDEFNVDQLQIYDSTLGAAADIEANERDLDATNPREQDEVRESVREEMRSEIKGLTRNDASSELEAAEDSEYILESGSD